MEGNKDESERCLDLAETCIQNGDLKKAEQYVQKAERLYASDRAKELLERVKRLADMESYSRQDLEIVQQINQADNYYKALGLPTDCRDEDVKKAYKLLALKIHPDKNHAPSSTEAFQALSVACQTLSDPKLRQEYDRSLQHGWDGTREDEHTEDGPTWHHEGYMSADEFYREFFRRAAGGGTPWTSFPSSEYSYRTDVTSKVPSFVQIYLSSIALMLIVGYFSVTPKTPQPADQPVRPAEDLIVPPTANYSLQRDSDFVYMRKTANLGVIYFVCRNSTVFRDHSARRKIDEEVENEYIIGLKDKCQQETAAAAEEDKKTRFRSCERLRSLNVGT